MPNQQGEEATQWAAHCAALRRGELRWAAGSPAAHAPDCQENTYVLMHAVDHIFGSWTEKFERGTALVAQRQEVGPRDTELNLDGYYIMAGR